MSQKDRVIQALVLKEADCVPSLIKKEYGQRICIKGNVDCTKALVYGTEKDVEEEVKACLHKAAYGEGYILSSSNTIHSGVKPENYVAMIKALRKYGKYPIEI